MYRNVVTEMTPDRNGSYHNGQTESTRLKSPVPAWATSIRGLEKPHDQQQFQIVLLAPHKDGTKQGRW